MQQSGKHPAAPGSDPKLDADDADELAANFKPAWEVDEPGESTIDTNDVPTIVTQGDAPTMTAVTQVNGSNGPAIVAMPVVSIGSPAPDPPRVAEPVRAPEPSSEAIEPDAVIEMQPAQAAMAFSKTQPMPPSQKPVSRPPPAPAAAPMSAKPRSAPVSRDPFAAAAKPIRPPIESDDFAVPKKSGKGWVYVVVGLLVAVGAGGIVKFYLTPEAPKDSPPQNVAVPTAAKEDIPPPPAKDETPTAPATTAAKVDPPPPEPAKAAPPPPQPVTPPPAPPPRQQPVAARGGGGGGMVRQPPPPAPAPAPKTPPKPPGGGIVRDSPF